MGWLSHVPYKGLRISGFDAKHLRELYPVRARVGRLAIELITESGSLNWSGRTGKYYQANERGRSKECQRKLGELDFAFHQHMIVLAGNGILTSAWNTVAAQSFRCLVITNFEYPDIDAIYGVHDVYLEIIRSGDWRKAREEIERTIIQFGEEMSKRLEDDLFQYSTQQSRDNGVEIKEIIKSVTD